MSRRLFLPFIYFLFLSLALSLTHTYTDTHTSHPLLCPHLKADLQEYIPLTTSISKCLISEIRTCEKWLQDVTKWLLHLSRRHIQCKSLPDRQDWSGCHWGGNKKERKGQKQVGALDLDKREKIQHKKYMHCWLSFLVMSLVSLSFTAHICHL